MSSKANDSADLIVSAASGGTILTMNDLMPTAKSIAVKDGKIVAIGDDDADIALRLSGSSTKVVTLRDDETLMPGLIEPHTHPSVAVEVRTSHSVSGFSHSSLDDVLAVMRDVVARVDSAAHDKTTPTQWISFVDWDAALVRDLPAIDADWIDANVTAKYPVMVVQKTMHCSWINRRGLDACGITSETPDPDDGGEIVRDANGKPTGMLKGGPAMRLAVDKIPPPDLAKVTEALFSTMIDYSRAGFTTVTDMGTLPIKDDYLALISGAARRDDFPVRWAIYYTPKSLKKPSPHHAVDDKVWFPGVKIWADGSPYVGTMACAEPYLDSALTRALGFDLKKCPRGSTRYADANALADALRPHAAELIASHAQGERAIDHVLDAYEILIGERPGCDHRYRLEHLGLITESQLRRASRLGVTVTFFTDHIYYYGDALADDILGRGRAERFAPAGLASRCGQTHWTLHQDSPVCPLDPMLCIQNAVLRRTRLSGRVLGPEYRVSVEDALKAYTIHAAWQLKRENDLGSLEVGKVADFVLLSKNPLNVEPEDLTSVKVLGTYLGGRCFTAK